MNMHSIRRKNLRALIEAKTDGNVAQFARQTGIDETRLSQVLSEKYRDGNNFGEKSARTFEQILHLHPLSLDALDTSKGSQQFRGLTGLWDLLDGKKTPPPPVGKRAIPILTFHEASEISVLREPLPISEGAPYLFVEDEYSEHTFALEIEDGSMLPIYKPGDTIVIDPDFIARPGDLLLVAVENEVLFRQYTQIKKDAYGIMIFQLQPLNSVYPTIRSDEAEITIIGGLVEQRIKVRQRR